MTDTDWERHMNALAEQAAVALLGTAKNLHSLGVTFEVASGDTLFCRRLDELVFECQECGWWCSVDELHNDELCEDCAAPHE